MTLTIKVTGMQATLRGLDGAIRALTPAASRANFRRIMRFAVEEVASKTPGKTLRHAWDEESSFKSHSDGFTFKGEVFNRKAQTRLYYQSALSGRIRAKRDASDKHQTYADIIPLLDGGTKPHKILPLRYPTLIFRSSKSPPAGSKDLENVVFTKGVSHPGTKAYKMLSDAREKLERLARTTVVRARDNVVRAYDSPGGLI